MNNKVSQAKNPPAKRRKQRKKAEGHSITERYEILDGAVTVIRTTKSGQFWSMSCWLKQESKCYRKSLRTKNKEEAIELARDQYFKLMGDIRAGNRIFSKKAKEIVEDFVKHKKSEADAGFITQERVKTIQTSLKWFLKFVGENTSAEKISKYKFQEYYVWRRNQSPEVRKVTLVNERAMISSLYKYGVQRGLFRYDQLPIFPMLKKSQVERRDAFDDKEYRKLYSCFPDWIKKSADAKNVNLYGILLRSLLIRGFVLAK